MALEFVTQPSPDEGMWQANRRLYLTADDRIVGEGDTDAAFLFAPEGGFIPLALALRYGLVTPAAQEPASAPAAAGTSEEGADAHGDTAVVPDAGS